MEEKDEYGLIIQDPKDKVSSAFYQWGRALIETIQAEKKIQSEIAYRIIALLEMQGIYINKSWTKNSSEPPFIVGKDSVLF